jgi:hypothetical protein
MVHPVKTPLNAVRTVTHVGLNAARHPLRTATDLTALGRGLVATVVSRDHPFAGDEVVRSSSPVAEPAPADPGETLKRQGDKLAERRTSDPDVESDVESVVESVVEDDGDELRTPAGTAAAGAGYNPDTTESGLDQPGTEPLMDPSTTKRIKSETDTLRKAADRDKT